MALRSIWFVKKIPLQKQNVLKHENFRSSHQRCSIKKAVLKSFAKFTGKHLRQSLFLNKVCNFNKKETLAQVFSCELCEKSKNTYFTEHFRTTISNPLTKSFSFIKVLCLEALVDNELGITLMLNVMSSRVMSMVKLH